MRITAIGASCLIAVLGLNVRGAAAQTQGAPPLDLSGLHVTATFVAATEAGTRADQPSLAAVAPRVDLAPPAGQDAAPEPTKPTRSFFPALAHNLLDDVKHIPRLNSYYWLVGGATAAIAIHPIDVEVNERFQQGSSNAFFLGKYAGSTPVQIGAALTTYIVGRIGHHPRAQHIGMDMFEAQLLTGGIVELTKVAVKRQRPPVPEGQTQTSGFSFPSGHSAITFATATVFQQHFGWKAAVPTYALATYVAMSRLHDNRHYASDVVFGAAVGVIVGRSVTWHGRNTYTLSAVALPGGLGAAIIW